MNKHNRKMTNNKELILLLIGIWGTFLLSSIYILIMRTDDVVYASRLDEFDYLGISIEYYKTRSSRIIIELSLMSLSKHFMLWKLLSSTIMPGIVVLLYKYVESIKYFV